MTTILFRKGIDQEHEAEFEIAKQYFNVVERRSQCPRGSTVVGRFSTLPFYRELWADLKEINSVLINSPEEHDWIANMDWAQDLAKFTPDTYTDHDFYRAPQRAYVVKGRTNSRKSHWGTHMFARDKQEAMEVANRLMADPLIAQQGLVYREYVPLVTYSHGINGQPFTNEWRFFYLGSVRLCHGRYWTVAPNPELATMDELGMAFARQVAEVACKFTEFFVLDIAQKLDGTWILVEVNEGSMAGLSECNPHDLYGGLKAVLGA